MNLDLATSVKNLTKPLSAIVAVSNNWAIGKNGSMPWHIPEDLKYFKKTTVNKPILMGRKTFESLGKPLSGRANIVISQKLAQAPPANWNLTSETSLYFCVNLQQGLKLADELASKMQTYEIMIIGGGNIYAQLLPYTNKIYLSRIDKTIADADTFFPKLDKKIWILQNSVQKDTFVAEVWQNSQLIDKNLDSHKSFKGDLTNLTNQIETKLEEVLHLFKKMALEKQKLQSHIAEASLQNFNKKELENIKNIDYEKTNPIDSKLETEDNNSLMKDIKADANLPQEQLKQEKSAKAPVAEQRADKKNKITEILEFWQKKYPETFFDQEAKPLKIGIHLDLIEVADFPEKMIKRALAHYTKRPRYLRSMQEGALRVDFNGETNIKVTKEDEQDAKKSLEIIRQRHKERDAKNPKKPPFKKHWNRDRNTEKPPFKKNFTKGGKKEAAQTKIYKKSELKKPTGDEKSRQKLNTTRVEKSQTPPLKPEDAQRLQTKLQKLSDKFSKSN